MTPPRCVMLLLPDGNLVDLPEIILTLRDPSIPEVISLINQYVRWAPPSPAAAPQPAAATAAAPLSRASNSSGTTSSSFPSVSSTLPPSQNCHRPPPSAQQHQDPSRSLLIRTTLSAPSSGYNDGRVSRSTGAVARCWRLLHKQSTAVLTDWRAVAAGDVLTCLYRTTAAVESSALGLHHSSSRPHHHNHQGALPAPAMNEGPILCKVTTALPAQRNRQRLLHSTLHSSTMTALLHNAWSRFVSTSRTTTPQEEPVASISSPSSCPISSVTKVSVPPPPAESGTVLPYGCSSSRTSDDNDSAAVVDSQMSSPSGQTELDTLTATTTTTTTNAAISHNPNFATMDAHLQQQQQLLSSYPQSVNASFATTSREMSSHERFVALAESSSMMMAFSPPRGVGGDGGVPLTHAPSLGDVVWTSAAAAPPTPPSSSLSRCTTTMTSTPSIRPAALSFLAALLRDQGQGLCHAMSEVLQDQQREAEQLRAQQEQRDVFQEYGAWDERTLLQSIPEEKMQWMREMGYPPRAAARALLLAQYDLSGAVEALSSNTWHAAALSGRLCYFQDVDDPFSVEELGALRVQWRDAEAKRRAAEKQKAAKARGGASSSSPGSPNRMTSSLPPVHSSTEETRPLPPDVVEAHRQRENFDRLVAMGFRADDVRSALRGTCGNFNDAVAALLGDERMMEKVRRHHADENTLWFEPIALLARNKTLEVERVLHVVRLLCAEPQQLVPLWYSTEYGDTLRQMATTFANNSVTSRAASVTNSPAASAVAQQLAGYAPSRRSEGNPPRVSPVGGTTTAVAGSHHHAARGGLQLGLARPGNTAPRPAPAGYLASASTSSSSSSPVPYGGSGRGGGGGAAFHHHQQSHFHSPSPNPQQLSPHNPAIHHHYYHHHHHHYATPQPQQQPPPAAARVLPSQAYGSGLAGYKPQSR